MTDRDAYCDVDRFRWPRYCPDCGEWVRGQVCPSCKAEHDHDVAQDERAEREAEEAER
jgi:predicted amidophosphoribosyltransferase